MAWGKGGTFSTPNNDGASAKSEGQPNTISAKEFRRLQEAARKDAPPVMSAEGIRRSQQGAKTADAARRGEN